MTASAVVRELLRLAESYDQRADHLDRRKLFIFVAPRLREERPRPHIGTMNIDLSDDESAALIRELADITGNSRYPLSPPIRTPKSILAKLRPEPVREPAPLPKVYAPRRAARRRG